MVIITFLAEASAEVIPSPYSETKGLSLEYMDRLFGSTKEGDLEQAVSGSLEKEQASYIESIPMTPAPKLPAVRE